MSSFIAWPWPALVADVEDVAGERLEDRPVGVEHLGGAAEHQRDRAGPGAGHAARHRPVDVRDADARRAVPRPPARPRGPDRREVDDRRRPPARARRRCRRRRPGVAVPSGTLSSIVSAPRRDVGDARRRRTRPPAGAPRCRRRRSTRPASNPAAAMRAAIGPPMLPSPTKPSTDGRGSTSRRRLRSDAFGFEHLAGQPERLDAGRHAGVDRDLDQRVAQLVERAPVAQRAAEVRLELLAAGSARRAGTGC